MAVAKYTEIYIALRARIEGGRYAFRQFLPSEKALTAEFGVTRNTLRKALRHLSSQGYVQSMQGRGVQVIYRPRASPRIFLSNIESFADASASSTTVRREDSRTVRGVMPMRSLASAKDSILDRKMRGEVRGR